MARTRAAKGSKVRSTGAAARSTVKSLGLFGAVAAALAGGGYYLGRNGPPLPEKIAALLPSQKPAPKAAQAPEARSDTKPAESAIVKLADKAELARLLKGAEAKIVGYVRTEPEKRARKAETSKADPARTASGKTEANKTEANKAEAAKADTVKPDGKGAKTAKMQVAKTEAAKTPTEADAPPMPPARIPDAGKAEAKSRAGRTEAQVAPRSDEAPASIAEALAEPEAATTSATANAGESAGGAPLGVALTGKGIPTSEDGKIRLSVGFSNRTGKPIRAFEGVLKFTDRADRGLFSSKISVSALIAEGGAINWDERVDPEKLGKKLVDADKDSLKAVFVPKKVFFVDGSVQQFGAKGERFAQR